MFKYFKTPDNKNKKNILDESVYRNRRFGLSKKFQVEKIMIMLLISIGLINVHLLIFFKVNFYDNLMINSNTPDEYYDQEKNSSAFNSNTYEVDYRKNLTDLSINIKSYESIWEVREIFNMPSSDRFYSCSFEIKSTYEYFFKKVWIWIDMLIYSLVPFIVMTITSIVILLELNFNAKRLSQSTQSGSNRSLVRKRNRRNNQLLIMLMATNIYFLVCSFPYFIGKRVFKNENHSNLSLLIDVLYYSNNSLNFIIYLLFSQKYRLAFFKILRFKKK